MFKMSYGDRYQTVSYTPKSNLVTVENITTVHLDIKDLASSYAVYKIGKFAIYLVPRLLEVLTCSLTSKRTVTFEFFPKC